MKTEEALPVCIDCNCVMFKKIIKGKDGEDDLEGWSCPECFLTKWGWINDLS